MNTKQTIITMCLCFITFGTISAQYNSQEATETARLQKEALQAMHNVNNYFMRKYADFTQPSHVGKTRPSNIWTRGVYYEGLMALYQIDPKSEFYDYALGWAEFHRWGLRSGNTTRNADDQCCGQTYIDLYNIAPDPEKIRHIQACMDRVVTTPQVDDWSWIDAIQMAMPVLAKLGKLTGDTRYYEKMYQMYSFTRNKHGVNGLFNPEEGLWWRDADFAPPYKEPNGKNSYWSRGNGWVYAALARVLEIIPANEPHRAEYTADFLAMSEALKNCRREDGFWNVSLHDPSHYGGKETTGTSLFVYGMAWGVNNGLLDRETYLPIVLQAWNAMVKDAVHPNGFLGWVQSTGKEPKDGQPVTYDKIPDFEDYGIGCFLLGGSEVYKLLTSRKPFVLFIGDSTVKNGAGNGNNGQWGWGDQIAQYFDTDRIAVVNRARGGRSSRTYISEGLWNETLNSIRAGDFVVIQFGHNDSSPVNDTARARGTIRGIGEETEEIVNLITKKHETVHTFGWYLRKYVADTKAKGATPIIVSPVPRDNFKDGKTIRNQANYGGWAKQVAESEKVPFIDLNGRVADEYDKIVAEFGQAVIDSCYFYGDHTHTSLTGAKLNARQVVAGIKDLPDCSLKDYLPDKKYGAISDKESFYFSTPLPEGDYEVTLLLGAPDKASETTVRGESRRLFLEKIKTKKGQYSEHSFTINIRNKHISPSKDVRIKPREMKKPNWDDSLTLEFTGLNPGVQSIRIRPAEQPLTVFLCGNSTVVDQDNEPWCGWGQMITRFFGQGISFANYAESGESANTFIAAGRLEKLLTQAKAGDYIFVEFGHNDQKQKGEGIGPWTSFTQSLKTFITEARKRGIHPVLLTPVQRRRFDEKGQIINTHGEYPDAIRKLADDEKVSLIDLHQMSKILYEALGEKKSLKAFVHYPAGTFPKQEKALEDNTHFNSYGGYEIARCVIEGVRQNGFSDILQYLRPEVQPFNPEKPDDVKAFSLPSSPFIEFEKPDGN
jgi:rhamnogalacturonyl hydrolase YesR/lysophospholipase L1-like esterase